MSVGSKRNQLCWCGSGKKYKKCHLNRESHPELGFGELIGMTNKLNKEKLCSVPEELKDSCTSRIIKAHTVSKSGSLMDIAKDSHVLGLKVSLEKIQRNRGRLTLEKVGINNASTFTGFCSFHDKEIFSPIENEEFIASKKNCFLLAYRALSREIYAKKSSSKVPSVLSQLDAGKGLSTQMQIQLFKKHYEEGNKLALKDLDFMFNIFKSALLNEDYNEIEHYIIEFDAPPFIQGASTFAPPYDFFDNHIQKIDLSTSLLKQIVINCFSDHGKGYFLLSWVTKHRENLIQFIESLDKIPDTDKWKYIAKFLFITSENIYCSIDWWDGLNEENKNNVKDYIMSGLSNNVKYIYKNDDNNLDLGEMNILTKKYI
ncbi:SEC-C domain-containing protein [Morganella morganii]|nr:SEC-C domain-containing protein [Morganella morganii]